MKRLLTGTRSHSSQVTQLTQITAGIKPTCLQSCQKLFSCLLLLRNTLLVEAESGFYAVLVPLLFLNSRICLSCQQTLQIKRNKSLEPEALATIDILAFCKLVTKLQVLVSPDKIVPVELQPPETGYSQDLYSLEGASWQLLTNCAGNY